MKAAKVVAGICLCLLGLGVLGGEALSLANAIEIDGKCDEWQDIKPVATDTTGDVAVLKDVDFRNLWVVTDKENVYMSYSCVNSIDWNTEGWKYNMFIDVDNDLNTGYRGGDMSWALGADFLLQGATIFEFSGKEQTIWDWKSLGLQTYSVDSSQIEVSISRDLIKIGEGATFKALLYGDNSQKIDFVPNDYATNAIIIEDSAE